MSDDLEIERRVMRKFVREGSKSAAMRAFWRFVKAVVRKHTYSNGFVEWYLVECDVQSALEDGPEHGLDICIDLDAAEDSE